MHTLNPVMRKHQANPNSFTQNKWPVSLKKKVNVTKKEKKTSGKVQFQIKEQKKAKETKTKYNA